jgi:hypothetical protein
MRINGWRCSNNTLKCKAKKHLAPWTGGLMSTALALKMKGDLCV